jgi:hypothetical protein
MFFWMYLVIELLALFLDSGIIPTSNVVYPVSRIFPYIGVSQLTTGAVVCRHLHWPGSSNVYLLIDQRLCRVPVC